MNIAVTVALLPALFVGDGGEPPSETTVLISAPLADEPPPPTTTVTTPPTTVPPTTVATAPPTTSAPTVAAAPKRQAVASTPTTHTHTHTHAHPKPKPKPTTTTTAPPPPPRQTSEANTESGRATWYELEGARAGICAHKTLPFGTIVTVTNTNTGKSIQCEIGDRGPFVEGYIIDLFRTDFEQLAPTSSGWFPAKITW